MTVSYSDIPKSAYLKFMSACIGDGIDYTYFQENIDNELTKFKAYSNMNGFLTFESEKYYNWFILKWS